MEIEIIKRQINDPLDSSRNFAIQLNKAVSVIKMLHWYVCDHNIHVILGDLYDDLTDLFDKLQEEIIGTSKEYNENFPLFNSTLFQLENIDDYRDNETIMSYYKKTVDDIKTILTSIEFNGYIANVKSGLNNTKEDILSRINKANYLLSMVKI